MTLPQSINRISKYSVITLVMMVITPQTVFSQNKEKSLAQQLHALQIKVEKLESALKEKQTGTSAQGTTTSKSGMKMGEKMSGMKKMSQKKMSAMGMSSMKKKSMMGGMSKKSNAGMGMMAGKGMSMMGKMKGMGRMKMSSALPGFAGASHIYHVGATGFFLDHSQHITLTKEQQIKLNAIKEKTLLAQATSERWVSQGEQELWVLTSSDTPDATQIEAKIREIEKTTSDQRIAYIRAVGEAAKVLTKEQRQTLAGNLPEGHTSESKEN